jgi:hypothetical protein
MNAERREVTRLAALQSLENLSSLAEVIADAVEAAMTWEPPPLVGVPRRWSCGCDTRDCSLRRDQMQDAGGDSQAVVKFTCIRHGLSGKSGPGRVGDGVGRLDALAMLNLDLAHQEQCR